MTHKETQFKVVVVAKPADTEFEINKHKITVTLYITIYFLYLSLVKKRVECTLK